MSKQSLNVSVPEAVCANTAMLRNLMIHLMRVGALSAEELDALFMQTRQDLAGGMYDADSVAGAQSYLDCLYRSMSVARIEPQAGLTH